MEINFLAVLLGALAMWVLGALWYSPLLFSKKWQSTLGFTDEYIKDANMPLIFGSSFVLMLMFGIGLTPLITAHGNEINFTHGFFHGVMTGVFFALPIIGINYLYQRRSIALWLIDVGYMILGLGLIGGILGAM